MKPNDAIKLLEERGDITYYKHPIKDTKMFFLGRPLWREGEPPSYAPSYVNYTWFYDKQAMTVKYLTESMGWVCTDQDSRGLPKNDRQGLGVIALQFVEVHYPELLDDVQT